MVVVVVVVVVVMLELPIVERLPCEKGRCHQEGGVFSPAKKGGKGRCHHGGELSSPVAICASWKPTVVMRRTEGEMSILRDPTLFFSTRKSSKPMSSARGS